MVTKLGKVVTYCRKTWQSANLPWQDSNFKKYRNHSITESRDT